MTKAECDTIISSIILKRPIKEAESVTYRPPVELSKRGQGTNVAVNSGTVAVIPPSGTCLRDVGAPVDVTTRETRTNVLIVLQFLCELVLQADTINNARRAEIHCYLRGRLNF